MTSGHPVFDADAHVLEPEGMWAAYLARQNEDYARRAPVAPGGGIWVQVEGKWLPALWSEEVAERLRPLVMAATRPAADGPYGTAVARRFDVVSHVEAMDREGIDRCVVYPTQGLYVTAVEGIDPGFAAALCRAYNGWVADFCAGSAGRVAGAAMVSLHDVDAAVAEARYAVATLGLCAVQVRPNRHGGRNLGDPVYEPLWAAVADLGVPLAVHEGTGARLPVTGADRFLGSLMLQHVTSHPLEMMCAVASMICGGVLERHPTLRVAFLEAGASWLPYWLWRLDEHVEWLGRGEAPGLRLRPSEYFRRQCFASVDCDETPLAHAIAAMGDDCFVFASDYPLHPLPSARGPPMSDPVSSDPRGMPQAPRGRISFVFLAALAATAAATTTALYVLESLLARRAENHAMERAGSPIPETASDPDDWRARFPEQYDSFMTPVTEERTPYGGNVPYSRLDADPRWKLLLAGNPFGVEWTEDRGHRHALADQEQAARLEAAV